VENKIKNKFTTPKNWEKILGTDGLSNLRLNLAHFGGEDQVRLTLNWTGDDHYENDPEPITYDNINPGSWTWTIIKLLKKHENTFSDISAFNFKDRKAVFSLGWLLCLDRSGEFDELGDYRLEDKLLWGSDYPMMLSNFNTYDEMMKGFVSAMDIGNLSYENYETPREKYGENLPNQADLIEKLTEKNPKKFLFGL
jgi:predicted TIM-barrel fold metal-dependent hydrolase